MKKEFMFVLCVALSMVLFSCAGITNKDDQTKFAVETMAMTIGYESGFEWSDGAEEIYQTIMAGEITIDVANIVQENFRDEMHPVILDRVLKLASMLGKIEIENGVIISLQDVDIELLQAAANGFKTGVMLESND